MRKLLFLMIIIVLVFSCSEENEEILESGVKEYIVLGHTRSSGGPGSSRIHSKVELYSDTYKQFDKRILLGDLTPASSRDLTVLGAIDLIFDIKNDNTLWTFGNHDFEENIGLALDYIGKPKTYFSQTSDDVLFISIDDFSGDFSNDNPLGGDDYLASSASSIVGEQLTFFNETIDQKASEVSTVILLTHKLLWLWNNPDLLQYETNLSNPIVGGTRRIDLNPNNFYTEIYPKLVDLKNQGKQVFCIAGDVGNKTITEFAHETSEGVVFLATGIKTESTSDADLSALILRNNIEKKEVSYKFKNLSEL